MEERGFEPLSRNAEAGLLRAQPAFGSRPPPAGGRAGGGAASVRSPTRSRHPGWVDPASADIERRLRSRLPGLDRLSAEERKTLGRLLEHMLEEG